MKDESTLRAYGSASDAYAVFRSMLAKGNPPGSWDALLKAASQDAVLRVEARSGASRSGLHHAATRRVPGLNGAQGWPRITARPARSRKWQEIIS